jgi:hypothetical protein
MSFWNGFWSEFAVANMNENGVVGVRVGPPNAEASSIASGIW